MNEIFAKRLREARESLGLSQNDLAIKLNVAKSTVSRYESGKFKRLPEPFVANVAKHLNVSPKWLIGLTNDKFDAENQKPLSNEEVELIKDFRKLNENGKNQAKTQMEIIGSVERYLSEEVLAAHNDSEITDKEVELMEEDAKSLEDLALKDERNKNNVDGV